MPAADSSPTGLDTSGVVLSVIEALTAPPSPPTFHALLEQLYRHKFRGPITLHFIDGVPGVVEFPQPVQLRLTRGA